MTQFNQSPDADETRFARRINELRQALTLADPYVLAHKTDTRYTQLEDGEGEFHLHLWGKPLRITYPGYVIYNVSGEEEISPITQAMLFYYYNTASGGALSGEWVSFAELPDGRFYNQAFQGYTGHVLANTFQNDRESFEQAASRLSGERQDLGDVSFLFQALPRVPLMVVYWQGDEEFPASCRILFDAYAHYYLPTDAYAILGSTLTRRLMAARGG